MTSTDQATFSNATASDVIDRDDLLDRFEGDLELAREIAALFLEDCPRRLMELRDAAARGDRKVVQLMAHSIRGSAGNFGATTAQAAALRVELLVRDGAIGELAEACTALEFEIARLVPVLVNLS